MTTIHYIEMLRTGAPISKSIVEKIPQRDASDIIIPNDVFAYRFFDRTENTINGKIMRSRRKNVSPMTYFGNVYSLKEIKEQFPDLKNLIRNMLTNNYKKAIKTDLGNWQPYRDGDVVTTRR